MLSVFCIPVLLEFPDLYINCCTEIWKWQKSGNIEITHACTYVCRYVFKQTIMMVSGMYEYIYTCIHVSRHSWQYACIYVHTCMSLYVCMNICTWNHDGNVVWLKFANELRADGHFLPIKSCMCVNMKSKNTSMEPDLIWPKMACAS